MALLAAACNQGPNRPPALGEAYIGPATLKLRADIPLESGITATVKHGERVDIVRRRRRFYCVRTASGAEGWTDDRQLLTAADMEDLHALSVKADKMPVQGEATTFGPLHVHTLPSRQAPSFTTIQPKEKVDVLADVVVPRIDLPERPILPPPPKRAPRSVHRRAREPKYALPPPPAPPGPPSDWLELSKTDLPQPEQEPEAAPPPKPVPTDYWSLVRLSTGPAGWVLTRPLFMSIPDQVAQYAEGRRIVSYFPLATVQDEDQAKHVWLWTTVGGGSHPYDFDSFRVFIWNLRHHRYETAFIARNVQGYAPVLVHEVNYSPSGSGMGAAGKYPGFSICFDSKDGQLYRREYALIGNIVRLAGEQPCQAQPPVFEFAKSGAAPTVTGPTPAPSAAHEAESFTQHVKDRLRGLTHRWFGR